MNMLVFAYAMLSLVFLLIVNLVIISRKKTLRANKRGNPPSMLDEPVLIEPSETSKANIAGPVNSPIIPPRTDPNIQRKDLSKVNTTPIVTVLMLGAFVSILNQTLDNVAIPHMMLDFNVSASTMQWLVTAYMLVNGVLIPVTAFLMETFGTRPLVIAAMSFFTVGSFICGISPNFTLLITGRVIQAVGAGILMPLLTNVFLTIYPPHKRGRAMGTMGIAMVLAPAIGPTLGGWVVETYTWRLLFYGMVPIGMLDLLLALILMKNVLKLTYPKFDLWGVVLSTIGFGSLLYGVSEAGNKGWTDVEIIVFIVVGLLSILLFIGRELSVDRPILEFQVFKYDIYALTIIINAVVTMAMYAGMMLLPIYLQNIRGFTPLQSGMLLLPGALIMGVMGPIAGAIFDRIGARLLAVVGLIITTLATWEFSKLTSETMYSHIITVYITRSFGMSLLLMPIMTAGLNQLPRNLNSHGTAMSNTLRQVAGALGTAILVTVMTARTNVHLASYANIVTANNPTITNQLSALTQGLALPAQTGQALALQEVYGLAAQQSAISGINDAFIVATGISMFALLLAFFIRRADPNKTNPSP